MVAILESKLEKISELCARFRVASRESFGSAIREDFNPNESDLDFLVEFLPMEPYDRVDAYFGLLDELRVLLDRDIDLVMVGAVKNQYIAHNIEQNKQLLYAA